MIDHAGWFGPHGSELFGWYTAPASAASGVAVLLCPPIGEEEHNAHETFRRLASALAAAGIPSLRFDYHGTGDSQGGWDDPARVKAWLDSISIAAETLRGTGISHVVAVGMRIGATLAAMAAEQQLVAVDALVMWDACSGKSMLREGQARRPAAPDPPEGAVDTPGYRYARETVAELHECDPGRLNAGLLPSSRLILTREDRPTPRGLRKAVDGPGVDWDSAGGQGQLLDVPMTDAVVPEPTLARVVEWVTCWVNGVPGTTSQPTRPVSSPLVEMLTLHAADGTPYVERVVRLGDLRLFGIFTEPSVVRREPIITLINVANDRHVGPGRRWVDLTRQLGPAGFRVLRMDQSSTGDSAGHPGQPFGLMYAREWLTDLPEALRSPLVDGAQLVLIGLCSGAYSALETAMVAPIRAVYAINVILQARVTSSLSPVADRRRLAARPPSTPFLHLGDRWPRPAAGLWRIYRQLAVRNAPMATVSALVGRGTDVILVMTREDGRHFREVAYWSVFRAPRLRSGRRLRHIESDAIDHALMTQRGQSYAMVTIKDDLLKRFPELDWR